MKRSRRWLLVLTAVVGLMAHADALRPLSLQFKNVVYKSPAAVSPTTKTTTTESSPPSSSTTESSAEEEVPSTENSPTGNHTSTTKSTLTGIPQVDYIWDPNLPRELNGYNLSDYPFHSSIPPEKEIGFKCDGLHDGFYASIKHKCQIYHHCIYGIRHDFLCANYTAFDQRTFICHFVSEVDCKNSEKYFFRNDALYKATTTSSTSTTTTTTIAPPVAPGKRLRRPFRRRRPVDYYYDEEYDDDYYEERVNRRQKNRPRPRRPDYDDYEDDTYEKRPYNRERKRGGNNDDNNYERSPADRPAERPIDRTVARPIDRPAKRPTDRSAERPIDRPAKRPIDRPAERPIDRPAERTIDHLAERPADRPAERPRPRKRPADSRRYNDDDDGDERVPIPRKPAKRRRPIDDYEDEDPTPSVGGGRRFKTNDRRPPYPKSDEDKYAEEDSDRRPLGGGRRRKGGRRPIVNDEEDELIDRPLRREPPPAEEAPYKDENDDKVVVVPQVRTSGSGSVYDRPRAPPRIAPPVPLTERKKFEYSTTKKTTTASSRLEDYYYDDYEDVKQPKKGDKYGSAGQARDREPNDSVDFDRPLAVKEDPKTRYETVESGPSYSGSYEENQYKNLRQRASSDRGNTKHTHSRNDPIKAVEIRNLEPPTTTTAKPNRQYNFDDTSNTDREISPKRNQPNENGYNSESRDYSSSRDISRPVVRVIKRPFLPSRGGSPYLPRGLQPVGVAQKPLPTESTPIDMGSTVSGVRLLEHGPPILRPNNDPDDYPPPRQGPRTTQQPQIEQERAALEKLYESEYDITLNDALNPTLKPITRGLHTGFPQSNTFGNRFAPVSAAYNFQDSIFASTDSKRSAAVQPSSARLTRTGQSRHEHLYYDYDY